MLLLHLDRYFAFGLRYMLVSLYYCLYCSFSWVSATSESGPLWDILLGRHHYPAKTENTSTRLFRPRILYEDYLLNLAQKLIILSIGFVLQHVSD